MQDRRQDEKDCFYWAGSFGFTRDLVRDILTFPALADSEIALMDIDAERLSYDVTYSMETSEIWG